MMKSKMYFKEFNLKYAFITSLVVTTLYLVREYFYKGINKFIIDPFGINQIEQSSDLDVLVIILIILSVGRIVYLISFEKLWPTINSLFIIISAATCYLLVIRLSNKYYLQPFGYYSAIKYLDVFFFLILTLIIKFRYYSSPKFGYSINGFIEDDFHPEYRKDFLGRRKYAYRIGTKILGTESLKKAFVIAINSPWGFGKSGFLLLIEEFLMGNGSEKRVDFGLNIHEYRNDINLFEKVDTRRQDVVVVRYNPWKNFDDKKVVQDFFDEFSSKISKYDSQLSKAIKTYGSYLFKLDESVFGKIAELSVDAFSTDPTLTALFDEINNAIIRIQKRIIVFVDDLDRLTGDELIDILKLIRNTANFRNTIFVVAYDHNYVLNTIDKKNLISNKEEYLQKIVQLEITLPVFQSNLIIQHLEAEIQKYDYADLEFEKIKIALNEIVEIKIYDSTTGSEELSTDLFIDSLFRTKDSANSILFMVLQNIRDVVRFVNSFTLSYDSIGKLADIYEIILLEFLKIRFLSIYQLIANKKFLKIESGVFQFDEDSFKLFCESDAFNSINIRKSETFVIKGLLSNIFSQSRKSFFRSVKNPQYFDIYFTYQAPNLIPFERLENALKQNIDEVIKIVDQSIIEGEDTFDDLRSFLNTQTEFGSQKEFEIILRTLFYVAKHDK